MAEIIKIADAVVSHLNGGGFDAPFSAKRMYLPRFDLKDMIALHVSVVPKATVITIADRRRTQHEHTIDIAVQKRLKPDTGLPGDPETDELDQLIETYSQGWTIARMPAVDRAIVRIGIWESLFNDEVPDGIAISEAVESATVLSTDDSAGFINGVLGRIAQTRG